MDDKQYDNLMAVLEKILDRMPVRDSRDPAPVGTPARAKMTEVAADKRQALAVMRAVLDDWVKGARENHDALGHRRENAGEECWRTFHASDIRTMINDAARELGVAEFPAPAKPEEDKKP
jgi:hypothetical protein